MVHSIMTGIKDLRPSQTGALSFSSTSKFSISTTPGWDGTMYYSTDNKIFKEWHGELIYGKNLYFKGLDNFQITGEDGIPWYFDGTNTVTTSGYLLSILNNQPATRSERTDYACYNLFKGNNLLTNTVQWDGITNYGQYQYQGMYQGCGNLVTVYDLPLVGSNVGCYKQMFSGCYSLVNLPEIELSNNTWAECYYEMFYGCSSLTTTPLLYNYTSVPELGFYRTFAYCTGLTSISRIKDSDEIALGRNCFKEMFAGCESLIFKHNDEHTTEDYLFWLTPMVPSYSCTNMMVDANCSTFTPQLYSYYYVNVPTFTS